MRVSCYCYVFTINKTHKICLTQRKFTTDDRKFLEVNKLLFPPQTVTFISKQFKKKLKGKKS